MSSDFTTPLTQLDPEVARIIALEKKRQEEGLEMIPSEIFPSLGVLQALSSSMNNKYSEGYPFKRYYGGNQFIDMSEQLAIDRAKQVFGCEHANVQPYSGSPANAAIYMALAKFGDTMMGMQLDMGGHLTHGHKVSFSGKAYHFVQFGVDEETGLLDMDAIRKLALEHKPKVIVSGFTAYPRIVPFKEFHEICEEVGAYSVADMSHISGLIAGGAHPSPFPFTDVVMTTTHKTLRGPRGAMIMCKEEDRLHDLHHPKSKFNLAQRIDKAVFPALQGGPHNHSIAAKAVALGEALKPEFKEYAQQIVKNSRALADSVMEEGMTLVSGGTDNHLVLADLRSLNVSGADAETALDKAGITVNKNTIPFDPNPPFKPSGIRFGTAPLTCRGMKESEMKEIGKMIVRVVKNYTDEATLANVKSDILEMTKQFPMYS